EIVADGAQGTRRGTARPGATVPLPEDGDHQFAGQVSGQETAPDEIERGYSFCAQGDQRAYTPVLEIPRQASGQECQRAFLSRGLSKSAVKQNRRTSHLFRPAARRLSGAVSRSRAPPAGQPRLADASPARRTEPVVRPGNVGRFARLAPSP